MMGVWKDWQARYALVLNVAMFFLAAALGFCCIVVPPYVIGINRYYSAPLFPIVRTAVENMFFWPSAIGLMLAGVLLGLVNPRFWFLLGITTMSVFPLLSVVEVIVSPTSHNLLPIEFFMYVLFSTPACIGAFVGRTLAKHYRRSMGKK